MSCREQPCRTYRFPGCSLTLSPPTVGRHQAAMLTPCVTTYPFELAFKQPWLASTVSPKIPGEPQLTRDGRRSAQRWVFDNGHRCRRLARGVGAQSLTSPKVRCSAPDA